MNDLKKFLDEKVRLYNRKEFIVSDPISIPHLFSKKQDIEIAGFFAAILAWGQRNTIINKCRQLIEWMDYAPYDFIINHMDEDLKRFTSFKHRTFNSTDALYFIHFLNMHYKENESLETAFVAGEGGGETSDLTKNRLIHFYKYFFNSEVAPERTRKHISTPAKGSACKRLNMYLRWMVRKDNQNVDFGIWERIQPNHLICPLDVHVDRVARRLNLIERKQIDWRTAEELTESLRKFDPVDPVKYDYALFGMGIMEKYL
ncbi:TIGR02757 family protein [Bacteroidota bacterium]